VLRRPIESALRSAVRVDDEVSIEQTVVQGLLQRIEHEIGPHRRVCAPAHDATREHIDHERDVHKTTPRRHVGEVCHPQLIGTLGVELPLHQILRVLNRGVGDGRAVSLAAHDTTKALRGHEPSDGASRHRLPVAQQLLPHFAHAIHATIALPHALDLLTQHVVALRTRRTPRRVQLACAIRVVAGRCDRQDAADRLDTVHRTFLVDERVHQRVRRSSSAAAKNALALRKMSLARFSSRFSRSSAASRSSSPRVGLDRSPASCAAFSSHRRSVSFVQPSFGAIAEMAAHWDGWCGSCSLTNRTARSRTSGLNRCARDFAMTPRSHKVEPPVIPGRFTFDLLKREDALRAELLVTLAEVAIEAGAFDAALDVLLVVLDWPLMPRVMIPAVASLLDLLRQGQHVSGSSDRVARIARSDWGHRCLTERAASSVIARTLEYAEAVARSEPALRAPSDRVLIALAIAECSFAFGDIARAARWIEVVEDAATTMHFHEQQLRVEALREALRTASDLRAAPSSSSPDAGSRTTTVHHPRAAAWRRFRTVGLPEVAPAIPALSV
jgi:hypothetical protein